MKIGIMSMQRVINYGSFLQSYSLFKNFEEIGAEVCMVDYHIEAPLVKKNIPKNSNHIKDLITKIAEHLFFPRILKKEELNAYWKELAKVEKEFKQDFLFLIGVDDKRNYNPELDLLVIGSDEVFNCIQPNVEVGYSRELFGMNNNAKKLISYAASFGNTMEEGLKNYGVYDEVKKLLCDFDGISVRDENSFNIVNRMQIPNVHKNVDPVFLYDYEEETNIRVPEKNYIIIYSYNNRISRKEAAKIISFARKNKKKIICIEGVQKFLSGFIALNPFQVLAYFKNADYIITDTFHGTVFSIKNNKQFVSIVRNGTESNYGNSEKLVDLLKTFKLEDRELKDINELDEKIKKAIDYKAVNQKILEEKKKAKEYILNFVEDIK